uniref:F-box domain-containing protein n=1 Tax=Caenorhabditis tropicalis TaxID=1561998 RepID=A0A1I7UT80_9PELO
MSSPLPRLSDLGFEEIPDDYYEDQMLSVYFPLFRLPDIVIGEILKNWSHKEILFVVQTSLRARRLISKHKIRTKLSVVDAEYDFYFQISYDHKEPFKIDIVTRGDNFDSFWLFQYFIPVRYQGNMLVSRWKEAIHAFQQILEFLDDVFRIKEISFEIKPYLSGRAVPIVEYVASRNIKFGSVHWSKFCGSDEMAGRFLMASKTASDLNFKGLYSNTFRFDHFHLFRMDNLIISNASWMTLKNILALRNCKQVYLGEAHMNTADINKILREIIENSGKLQELRMHSSYVVNMEEAIKDLEISRIENANIMREKKYWLTGNNGKQISATKLLIDVVEITIRT